MKDTLKIVPSTNGEKISLTYRNVNDRQFIESLRGLVAHKWDAMTTAYKLSRVMDKVDEASKTAQAAWIDIMNTQIEWNGEGNDRTPKDPMAVKAIEEKFLATSFDLGKWNKFNVQELLGYKFSAIDIHAVKPLLSGFEILEEGE